MNKIYTLPEDELRGEIYQRMLRLMGKNRGAWQSVAAAVSLFGGLLAIVLGVLDWAVVGLFAPAGALGSFLDTAGTILLVLPLTLLALGAFCLDLLEKKPPALPLPAEPRPAVPLLRHYRRPRRARLVALSGFVLLLSGGLRPAVRAQQTLFNVPSADVLDSGRVYAELDVSFKPVEPKFSSFVPRVVVSVGRYPEPSSCNRTVKRGAEKLSFSAPFFVRRRPECFAGVGYGVTRKMPHIPPSNWKDWNVR